MTTFICISPAFPETNVFFCEHLAKAGVTVLGIGDTPYDLLPRRLTRALTEYFTVGSLEDYDDVYRAVAFLAYRHGHPDWLESNNEYWLALDARLRTDFHITTGIGAGHIDAIKSKAAMKTVYAAAGIPTARQARVTDLAAAREFAASAGYPLIIKPEFGVGAVGTTTITDDDALAAFFAAGPAGAYVMEEFVTGEIMSYDAIVNAAGDPVFEVAVQWPPSISDIVEHHLDLGYRVLDEIPPALADLGRRTTTAFGVFNRFVHLEFFQLTRAKAGLGGVGDFVALEVNMRPAGGYTLDMYNFATGGDVYQIYADLVTGTDSGAAALARATPGLCVYAGRRDQHSYRVSREDLVATWGDVIVKQARNLPLFRPQMGDEFVMIRTTSRAQADAFLADALDHA